MAEDFDIINEDEIPEDARTLEDDIKTYKLALQQEWNDKNNGKSLKDVADGTREQVVELIPTALVTLKNLAMCATSEQVRAKCALWILENVMAPKGLANINDPLENFMAELDDFEKAKDKE